MPSVDDPGAGKTTLLNALSGRATYAKVTGSVTLKGRALSSDDLNYVPQFDDLNDMFSPRELLTYMRLLQVVDGSSSRVVVGVNVRKIAMLSSAREAFDR